MLQGFEEDFDFQTEAQQDAGICEDEQEPEIAEDDQGPFYLEVYNPCTGSTEIVEVNRDVYIFMRRSAWRDAKRTRAFYRNEIQYTSMSNGNTSQVENFHEFESSEPTPEEALFQKKRKQLAALALDALTPTMRKRYLMHYYDGLSFGKIAKIEGKDKKTIEESVKCAQKIIEKFLRNFDK